MTLASPSRRELDLELAWSEGRPFDAQGDVLDGAFLRAVLIGRRGTALAPGPLHLSNAVIAGGVDLRAVRVRADGRPVSWVGFESCVFEGSIDLRDAQLPGLAICASEVRATGVDGACGDAVRAEALETNGSVDLSGSIFVGRVVAGGSRIGGDLELSRCEATQGIRLVGARIGGRLHAASARLTAGEAEWALDAEDATIGGAVILESSSPDVSPPNRFEATGGVNLIGASMSSLTIRGARLTAPSALALEHAALRAEGCRVPGLVLLDRCTASGSLTFVGAQVGELQVANCVLDGGDATAFAADRLVAQGVVTLRQSRAVDRSAAVQGAIRLPALSAASCRLENLEVEGEIALAGARVGDLRLLDLQIGLRPAPPKPTPISLDLRGARIAGRLEMRGLCAPDGGAPMGEYRLENANCAVLADDLENVWPAKGRLRLDGFTYGALRDPPRPDAADRLAWLDRQFTRQIKPGGAARRIRPSTSRPEFLKEFARQPYEQLAAVLRAYGHSEAADEVALAKRDAEAELSGETRLGAFRAWVGKSVRHGYRWRLMFWAVISWWGLGVVGIWLAVLCGGASFARVHPDLALPPSRAAARFEGPRFELEGPIFDSRRGIVWGSAPMSKDPGERGCPGVMVPIYALELMVPIADVGQASDCRLESEGPVGGLVQALRVAYQAIGAFFVAVLGISFAGFLRKD